MSTKCLVGGADPALRQAIARLTPDWAEWPGAPSADPPGVIVLQKVAWTDFLQNVDEARQRWPRVPVLGVMQPTDQEAQLRSVLERGVDDFLFAPVNPAELAARLYRLGSVHPSSSAEFDTWKREHGLDRLIGSSDAFAKTLRKVPLLAHPAAPVLLLGETGCGKELFARALHYLSPRKSGPFVPLNCGAVPEHLFENELFGHARGAYTGAIGESRGLLATAESGTLFLDEVDSLPAAGQVKLLRFLQEQEYRRLGSPNLVRSNVRILAATNADPKVLIDLGRLRQDLYFRLGVLRLTIPPLRDRQTDIVLLAEHFVRYYSAQHGRPGLRISPAGTASLLEYGWPGNVRELEGVVHRAVLLAEGARIEAHDFELGEVSPPSQPVPPNDSLRRAKARVIGQFEKSYLQDLLARFHGNVSQAAEAAGKERRTFQRLMERHGITRHPFLTNRANGSNH